MIIVSAFNPISNKSGTFIAQTLQNGGKMIVHNKSYVDIELVFPNGIQTLILANDRRAYGFNDITSIPNPVIQWTQLNIDYPQTVKQLENVVYVEVYQPSEQVIETYPSPIQREPTPNLIPYNIGYGAFQFGLTNAVNTIIWPSSYIGLAVAPTFAFSGTVSGLGYDHFYSYQNLSLTTMKDLPGVYTTSTGKTENDAAPFGTTSNAKYIPGPFSQPGLTPIDTGTQTANEAWNVSFLTQFQTLTSWNFEVWVYFASFNSDGINPNPLFTDNIANNTNTGLNWYIDRNGILTAQIGYTGGRVILSANNPMPLNQWVFVCVTNSGNGTANNIQLWVNGIVVASATSSGSGVLGTNTNSVLFQYPGATGLYGAFAYYGIVFNYQPSTNTQSSIAARYEHGLQSLNQDYQNVWLSRVDFFVETVTAVTTSGTLNIQKLYNTAGLLYALTPSNTDKLHIYNPQQVSSFVTFPPRAANQFSTYPFAYQQPLSHPNDIFITLNTFGFNNTNESLGVNVQGYNILGLA